MNFEFMEVFVEFVVKWKWFMLGVVFELFSIRIDEIDDCEFDEVMDICCEGVIYFDFDE